MNRAFRAVAITAAVICSLSTAALPASAQPSTPDTTDIPAALTLTHAVVKAVEAGADSPDAITSAVGTPGSGRGSLRFDDEGRLSVTITFERSPGTAQLDAIGGLAEIVSVQELTSSATAWVAPDALAELRALDGLRAVTPVVQPVAIPVVPPAVDDIPSAQQRGAAEKSCRAFPSTADAPLHTADARKDFGVDGTGVTIGILSDSYDAAPDAETTPDEDVKAGLLPGPGNPCGYETPVTVLSDIEPDEGGGDEGRAMAQLVHGIAPGARIVFYTGWRSSQDMAKGIVALADAGATVIVDDIGWSEEPLYQQGWISTAITQVQSRGVAYYTAAGNGSEIGAKGTESAGLQINGWRTPAYRPMDCPSWVTPPEGMTSYDCLDFDPSAAQDATDTATFPEDGVPSIVAQWGDPLFGLTTALVPQLYVDEKLVSESYLDGITPTVYTTATDVVAAGDLDVVVLRDTSTGSTSTPALSMAFWSPGLSAIEYDRSQGDDVVGLTSVGHPADGSGIGVAAAFSLEPDVPERFTSAGDTTLLFEPVRFVDGTPVVSPAYPEPLRVMGPQIASVDGIRTSFFAQRVPSLDDDWYFFGTSAAAPTAAAVHALALEYAPQESAADIARTAFATAGPLKNPTSSSVTDQQLFGAGLIDAHALLTALPARPVTDLQATALSPTSLAVSWVNAKGSTGTTVQVLSGSDVLATADLAEGVDATTFRDLPAGTALTVTATAEGAAQDGPVVSVAVDTPPLPGPTPTPAPTTSPRATATPTPVPVPAGDGRLAQTGTDASLAPTLAGGALALMALGAALVVGRRARTRRAR
ncbi:hypothetical protein NS183_03050 [Microbacterium testaceum]|uniref:hypothetical protein n=1 Tax=Microbacterium testaceum TaxID=2033 RepID=UPI000734586E|nr:hypothetical protein [Microbacterium testaceum]KTS91750.1 hypothetical protein NS183_03050 [Microbacterium testaceum]